MTSGERSQTHGTIRRIENALLSTDWTERLLFNDATGAFAEYVEAARKRRRYRAYRDRYDVDPGFEFRGPGIELYGRGCIELGADSYVGHDTRMQAKEGTTIGVGENTAVSHYVFVYTQNRVADQDMSRARNRNRYLAVETGDVSIGAHCWIGAFTFVTEDTSVGDNTVVGANSVVTDDLPPHCIAAGAPARVRRFKSYLDDEHARELAAEYESVLSERVRSTYASALAAED